MLGAQPSDGYPSTRNSCASIVTELKTYPDGVRDAVLAAEPSDSNAQAVKLYALVSCSRYADALSFIVGTPGLAARAQLEHAYCTWKTGHTADALQLLQDAAGDGAQHLKALLLTRMGEHAAAHELYTKLCRGVKGDKQAVIELVRARSTCSCSAAIPISLLAALGSISIEKVSRCL